MSEDGDKTRTMARPLSVDKDLVRDLAALLDETGLSEIEVGDQGRTLRVARNAAPVTVAPAAPQGPTPEAPAVGEVAAGEDLAAHPGAITSPMVGTAYVSPEPGAPPFVKVGDQVAVGDTLLIVEAMKTMNPIPAPRDGRVARILIANGTPVEFGEALMILD
jgi:acetyl-CoA carboxylase biotin carboxyl carrier protein